MIDMSEACNASPLQRLSSDSSTGLEERKEVQADETREQCVMNRVFPILSEMPSRIVDHALPFHTLSGSLKRHTYIHLFGP